MRIIAVALACISTASHGETFDFTAIGTSGSWAPSASDFEQDTVNFTAFLKRGQTANGSISALASPTGGTGEARAKVVSRSWGSTISAEITFVGVNGYDVTDDKLVVGLVTETGANAWKGYWWIVGSGYQRLSRQDSATAVPDTGNVWLAGSTSEGVSEGDTFKITINTATGSIVCAHNGATVTTVTDTTYTFGLTPAFYASYNNHAGTGISKLETTGEAPGGGSSIVPQLIQQMSRNDAANDPDFHPPLLARSAP